MIERYFYKLALIGQVMSSKSVKFNFDSVVEKKFIRSSKDAIRILCQKWDEMRFFTKQKSSSFPSSFWGKRKRGKKICRHG